MVPVRQLSQAEGRVIRTQSGSAVIQIFIFHTLRVGATVLKIILGFYGIVIEKRRSYRESALGVLLILNDPGSKTLE